MIPPSQIDSTLLFVFKSGIVILMFLYIIFAAIVIKQVNVMTDTLEVGFERPIKLAAILHFTASLIVLMFALFSI